MGSPWGDKGCSRVSVGLAGKPSESPLAPPKTPGEARGAPRTAADSPEAAPRPAQGSPGATPDASRTHPRVPERPMELPGGALRPPWCLQGPSKASKCMVVLRKCNVFHTTQNRHPRSSGDPPSAPRAPKRGPEDPPGPLQGPPRARQGAPEDPPRIPQGPQRTP